MTTLITGGAGFIGTNLAHRLLTAGEPVLLYDSIARPGVERNLAWLREMHGDRVQIEIADIRQADVLGRAVARASQIFHFAAQVAVTTSLLEPLEDFDVNARGTLLLLEAIRAQPSPPPLVFTSTNKVYGALSDICLHHRFGRYDPSDPVIRRRGVDETRPLDFHSPYGCSKGAADQYVLDYARTFGLPAIVLRMSCIYGRHQHGTEDQGWVAHFALRALDSRPIRIYGDGRQVRDILFADDLVEAMFAAQAGMAGASGQAYNIGGGPDNAVSLLEVLDVLTELTGHRPETEHRPWRTGDQRYYVSNTAAFRQRTGWQPRVRAADGIGQLYRWLAETRGATTQQQAAGAVA